MENFAVSTFVNWLHLMATVAWIGGMIVNFTIVLPSMGKALDPPTAGKFIGIMMKKYRVMVYMAILILLITGFIISLADGEVGKYFDFNESSSIYFTIKHILVLFMVVLSVISFEVVGPKVAKTAAAGPSPKLAKMQTMQKSLGMVALLTGILIVLFSVMI